jgi:hypothetical protein
MKKIVFGTLIAFLSLSAAAHAEETVSGTTLDISSHAETRAAPDIATISAGVITANPSANKALQENTAKMGAVFKALKDAKIEEKDIQTSGVNINPQYVYAANVSPRITGYQVNNDITAVVRDIKNIGPVLDALVAQGVNNLSGPSFSIENQDDALDKARKEAVEKAQKRARMYADAAGLKVKRIISINEQAMFAPPAPYPMGMKALAMRGGMAQEATPISPGQVSLDVTVNVRYELMPQ